MPVHPFVRFPWLGSSLFAGPVIKTTAIVKKLLGCSSAAHEGDCGDHLNRESPFTIRKVNAEVAPVMRLKLGARHTSPRLAPRITKLLIALTNLLVPAMYGDNIVTTCNSLVTTGVW